MPGQLIKPASLSLIKKELQQYHPDTLRDIILRLSKLKTENKELLSYLLFDSQDLGTYIADVKVEIDNLLDEAIKKPSYKMFKDVKKIVTSITRVSRYTGFKETQAELLVYLCKKLIDKKCMSRSFIALNRLFEKQLDKVENMLQYVHEDLRSDYSEEIRILRRTVN